MREITESKEVIKKIYMEKIKMDFQSETAVPPNVDKEVGMVLERTKVMDIIFLKYNLKQIDLQKACEQYKLDVD